LKWIKDMNLRLGRHGFLAGLVGASFATIAIAVAAPAVAQTESNSAPSFPEPKIKPLYAKCMIIVRKDPAMSHLPSPVVVAAIKRCVQEHGGPRL
jgi:hypothetical protein